MSLNTTGLENREEKRVFSSPVALAFVRIVCARRGCSETEARKIYQDYIDRAELSRVRQPIAVA